MEAAANITLQHKKTKADGCEGIKKRYVSEEVDKGGRYQSRIALNFLDKIMHHGEQF